MGKPVGFEEIRVYYEKLYEQNRENSFPFDRKRTKFMVDFCPIPSRNGGHRSLDIGCGVGFACGLLKESGYVVYGIDISPQAVKIAAERLKEGHFSLAASTGMLPYPDRFFTTILCLGVLEHMENPEFLVRESYRVLQPGGTAVFLVPNSLSPYFLFGRGTGQILEAPRSLREWRNLLIDAGYRLTAIRKDPGPTLLPSFPVTKRFKHILNKAMNLLPAAFAYQLVFVLEKG